MAETANPSIKAPAKDPLFVNSLQKGFMVLSAFGAGRQHLSLAEITRITGLEKSAVQRFVHTLFKLGYLKRNEATKLYSISPKMMDFAYSYFQSDVLIETAQPFLVEAHEKIGETLNLAVVDGADVIIAYRLPSRHAVSVILHVGSRLPALYSSPGLAICAFLDPASQEHLLAATEIKAHTNQSATSKAQLIEAIAQARRDGFSVTQSQFYDGDISVSAPIMDGAGNPVGAIGLAVPQSRYTLEQARGQLAEIVVGAARQTSSALVLRERT